jgi:DNA polymerase elongation subunit (family B)
MVGHKLIVDKCTLEDAITFQGYEFKVNKGVYWNQGFNTNIGATIEGLFQERLKAKKAGNEGQQKALKLVLNSSYGKCAL